MLKTLKSLFKAVIGGASYKRNPLETGAIYIKDELKKANSKKEYSREFLLELSQCAQKFSEQMYMMSKKEEKVTYFVNHLNYIVILLLKAEDGGHVEASDPIKSVLVAHGVSVSENC